MFDCIDEIRILPQNDLKSLLVEALEYKCMTTEQQYNSGLYKLLSDTKAKYGNHVTMTMLVDNLANETASRVATSVKRKS